MYNWRRTAIIKCSEEGSLWVLGLSKFRNVLMVHAKEELNAYVGQYHLFVYDNDSLTQGREHDQRKSVAPEGRTRRFSFTALSNRVTNTAAPEGRRRRSSFDNAATKITGPNIAATGDSRNAPEMEPVSSLRQRLAEVDFQNTMLQLKQAQQGLEQDLQTWQHKIAAEAEHV